MYHVIIGRLINILDLLLERIFQSFTYFVFIQNIFPILRNSRIYTKEGKCIP